MHKTNNSIPVNHFDDEYTSGISIETIVVNDLPILDGLETAHRHDRHSFFLLEKGTVSIEIDFQKYTIVPSSVLYMHPNQVHRIVSVDNVTVSSWALNNENLNPEYLKLLERITPVKPLVLDKASFSIISEAVALCQKFAARKNDKLYHTLLKDSCNALVALVISHYLDQAKPTGKLSRFDTISQVFREILEQNYTRIKRPAAYAQKLNISAPYLNECVKNTTGFSVSHHIQQRIILEAKRLLFHSDKSVKEIAAELGYDDYPYFSRLFTKVTGMTAIAFRKKNLD